MQNICGCSLNFKKGLNKDFGYSNEITKDIRRKYYYQVATTNAISALLMVNKETKQFHD